MQRQRHDIGLQTSRTAVHQSSSRGRPECNPQGLHLLLLHRHNVSRSVEGSGFSLVWAPPNNWGQFWCKCSSWGPKARGQYSWPTRPMPRWGTTSQGPATPNQCTHTPSGKTWTQHHEDLARSPRPPPPPSGQTLCVSVYMCVCACVSLCVCQGNNSNHAQTARFNNPTDLALLQNMSSLSSPAGGAALTGSSLHIDKCRQRTATPAL